MRDLNTKRNGVRVVIVETGEEFHSIQACADYLGVNVSWLGKIVRGERGLKTCHGYHIVTSDDYDDNLYFDRIEYRGRPGIKVHIVETGETFDSIASCARAIDGSPGSIHNVLKGKRITHKGYHFVTVI